MASLVDLKAEVFRKAEEARFNQRHGKGNNANVVKREVKKVQLKKNQGIEERRERDEEEVRREEKVKKALERKAELYEKMKEGGNQGGDQERFLVNFNSKKDEDETSSDEDIPVGVPREGEEWVEYQDALGRTRTCMKKDLPHLIRQDKDIKRHEEEVRRNKEEEMSYDLMSEDMRRELLRKKWEKEEEDNLKKRDVHYQDVLFDEARSHGAGFYRFSKDEVARTAEREELDTLHEETKKARNEADKNKAKKKAALAERLRKVRDRKRLRMGLPMLPQPEGEENGEEGEEVAEKPDDDDEGGSFEQKLMLNLKAMREEAEEKERERKRRSMVREWDVGKEGVPEMASSYGMKGEKKILSQKEWVDEKRKERKKEFAPPSETMQPSSSRSSSGQKKQKTYASVPPPPSMAKEPSSSSRQKDFSVPPPPPGCDTTRPPPQVTSEIDDPESIPTPSDFGPIPRPTPKSPQKPDKGNAYDPSHSEEPFLTPVSSEDRLRLHREMASGGGGGPSSKPKLIRNEILEGCGENDPEEDEEEEEESGKRKRAEIAPPCSMDYYSSSTGYKKGFEYRKGFRSHEEMSEAFDFGRKSQGNKRAASSEDDSD